MENASYFARGRLSFNSTMLLLRFRMRVACIRITIFIKKLVLVFELIDKTNHSHIDAIDITNIILDLIPDISIPLLISIFLAVISSSFVLRSTMISLEMLIRPTFIHVPALYLGEGFHPGSFI